MPGLPIHNSSGDSHAIIVELDGRSVVRATSTNRVVALPVSSGNSPLSAASNVIQKGSLIDLGSLASRLELKHGSNFNRLETLC